MLIDTCFLLLAAGLIYWYWKNLYFKSVLLESCFELEDLEYQIMTLKAKGLVSKNSYKYQFLESTITDIKNTLPFLNIFVSVLFYIRNQHSDQIKKNNIKRLKVQEDKYLSPIDQSLSQILTSFFKKNHRVSFSIFKTLRASLLLTSKIKKGIKRSTSIPVVQAIPSV